MGDDDDRHDDDERIERPVVDDVAHGRLLTSATVAVPGMVARDSLTGTIRSRWAPPGAGARATRRASTRTRAASRRGRPGPGTSPAAPATTSTVPPGRRGSATHRVPLSVRAYATRGPRRTRPARRRHGRPRSRGRRDEHRGAPRQDERRRGAPRGEVAARPRRDHRAVVGTPDHHQRRRPSAIGLEPQHRRRPGRSSHAASTRRQVDPSTHRDRERTAGRAPARHERGAARREADGAERGESAALRRRSRVTTSSQRRRASATTTARQGSAPRSPPRS